MPNYKNSKILKKKVVGESEKLKFDDGMLMLNQI